MKKVISYFENNPRLTKDLCWMVLVLINAPIFAALNRPIGKVHDLYGYMDTVIPLVPFFIVIYHTWYPLMITNAFMQLWRDRDEYFRLVFAIAIGQTMAYLTFIFFQTTVTRPVIPGSDFFSEMIKVTYSVDNHYSGFPSVHVLYLCIEMISCCRSWKPSKKKTAFLLYCALIIPSTVLVKQHVFWDIPGGILYGFIAYALGTKLFNVLNSRGIFNYSSSKKIQKI